MKNKKLVWSISAVIIVLIAALAITATQTDLFKGEIEKGEEITFGLAVTVGGEEVIFDEDVEIASGTSLIDAMAENITENGGVVYSDGEYGAYITSICGYEENADTAEYWVYTLNGESAMVGASDYCPAEGDEIVFDLSPLVW